MTFQINCDVKIFLFNKDFSKNWIVNKEKMASFPVSLLKIISKQSNEFNVKTMKSK